MGPTFVSPLMETCFFGTGILHPFTIYSEFYLQLEYTNHERDKKLAMNSANKCRSLYPKKFNLFLKTASDHLASWPNGPELPNEDLYPVHRRTCIPVSLLRLHISGIGLRNLLDITVS